MDGSILCKNLIDVKQQGEPTIRKTVYFTGHLRNIFRNLFSKISVFFPFKGLQIKEKSPILPNRKPHYEKNDSQSEPILLLV